MFREFRGSTVAIVTPFKDDQVDVKALQKLVEFHIANGTNGILPCGTTGESCTLDYEEHEKVIEVCIQTAKGRVPVMAGTGSNSTDEAVKISELRGLLVKRELSKIKVKRFGRIRFWVYFFIVVAAFIALGLLLFVYID